MVALNIESLSAEGGAWINKPESFSLEGESLKLTTEANTDFWKKTYYEFDRFTGHAFGFYIQDNFTVQVKISADFSHLYDQAGIFVSDDENHWVKAGIEYNDGNSSIGCVVTRETSDWSTGVFPGNPKTFWMRATLENEALRIQYSVDGKQWPLLRLCAWPGTGKRFVGVMSCTPQRQGLEVTFDEFSIVPPLGKELHDLS